MLFLKSKESKSSSSHPFKIKGISLVLLNVLAFLSLPIHAQDSTDLSSITQIASIFFSLLFVIAIIFGIAFIMRRFNVTQAGKGELKIVASLVAGTKERIIVIQVGQEQHLLGITSHNINHLAQLTTPINVAADSAASNSQSFQHKLTQAMAHAINPTSTQPSGESK